MISIYRSNLEKHNVPDAVIKIILDYAKTFDDESFIKASSYHEKNIDKYPLPVFVKNLKSIRDIIEKIADTYDINCKKIMMYNYNSRVNFNDSPSCFIELKNYIGSGDIVTFVFDIRTEENKIISFGISLKHSYASDIFDRQKTIIFAKNINNICINVKENKILNFIKYCEEKCNDAL